MRRKIVAGNWKMNTDVQSAAVLAHALHHDALTFKPEVIVFPPFVFISEVRNIVKASVKVGAQNCSEHENGAYTGEVSAKMLASMGVDYVLIGHSERREYFKETNEQLKRKLQLALSYGLKPVFCCGEPLMIRETGKQEDYVRRQLEESLFGLSIAELEHVVVAYEPVWAIGTGLNASPAQAQEMHAFIRKQLTLNYSEAVAEQVPILYGGSCKPDNAASLFTCPDVDGGLIGGASLKAEDFLAIINAA